MKIKTLESKGFVKVEYPTDLRIAVKQAERSWRAFCKLPIEVKQKFEYSNDSAGVGYEMKEGSGPMSDVKENFDVALSGLGRLEAVLQLQADYNFVVRQFVNNAVTLIELMTPFIVDFAEQAEKIFDLSGFRKEIERGTDTFFVRFIHYPPQKRKGELIAQAHPDQSGMTLHLFESAPGLQRLDVNGKWISMPVSDTETVIIPDMQMQLRSKGLLMALWHRVVATKETAKHGRYSAVSFIQFQKTPKYDKETHGRLQEKEPGWNYSLTHEEFSKLFK